MKPIEKSKHTNVIGGVKIYIDDLEQILYKLNQDNFNIIISDDDNTYDSVDELKQFKGNNPKIIKIEAQNDQYEYIYIRIEDNVSSIVSKGKNVLSTSYEIEKILNSRKNKLIYTYFLNSKNAIINLTLVSILAFSTFVYKRLYTKDEFNKTEWFILIVLWLSFYLFTLINPNTNGNIELNRRHENNFFKQNKTTILVGVISTILTAMIAIIFKFIEI